MDVGFERVWRFRVAAGSESAFEELYGANGAWARLFSLASGYRGTELRRLEDAPGEYLLVDRWESRHAWDAFRQQHGAAYEALDRDCAHLTLAENLVRETDIAMRRFWVLSAVWVLIVVGSTPVLVEALDGRGIGLMIPGLSVTASEVSLATTLALVPPLVALGWIFARRRAQPAAKRL